MPFPLAHPAAVMPLRRFCPAQLNLPGLIIGSLIPDAGYLLTRFKLEELSHGPLGLGLFCLPFGLLLVVLLYRLRDRCLSLLPGRIGQAFLPQSWQPSGPPWRIVLSILLGAALHISWDAFTHPGGWAVKQLPALGTVLGSLAGHEVRFCRVLWYGSSFAGVAAVYLAYSRAQSRVFELNSSRNAEWLEAGVVAGLVVPIELVHDVVRDGTGGLAVAVLSALLVGGVLWRIQDRAGAQVRVTG